MSTKAIVWSVIGVLVLVLILFLTPFTIIGVGEKGIVINFGKVSRVLDPGIHGLTPFTESVVKMDIQTQKEQTDATAASADLQNVNTSVAINYNVDPSKVVELYSQIGTSYASRVIDPAIQEAVKAATAKYTAEELITKRPAVTEDIKTALTERLTPDFITVTSVSITNFAFSATFNAAIEAKVTAEQNALAAKNKLAQIEYEAQQTVATAKATAESIRLQSDAANNEKYVRLKQVEVQLALAQKWDGKLPVNMYAGAPLPLLNITGLSQ